MSRIAPDLPELREVPDPLRSIVYTRALLAANRSPLTWLIGALVFVFAVGVNARLGSRAFGAAGGVLGAAFGALAAAWCFFMLILPWRTRRLLPSAIEQAAGPTDDT